MHLILSRKGFDSASGGCPSPILPDGSMLALPIPDERSPIRYRDLSWHGHNLGDLVERLTGGKVKADHPAHLDPDLQRGLLSRPAGWRPLFGQTGPAQGHLRNEGIAAGDVFLFWGLFRRVDERWRWVGPKLHVVWGWLQVGEVMHVDAIRDEPSRAWTSLHPHLAFAQDPGNTLYAAASSFTAIGEDVPAAGVFLTLDEAHVLSDPASASPRVWSLPSWFVPKGRRPLTYHGKPSVWTAGRSSALLETVCRGQEFVLDCEEYPEARGWIRDIVARVRRLGTARRRAAPP